MKKIILYIPKIASYFFILLFCYAAISKVMDFENFQVQIGQSPLLSAYASFISYAVIILEVIIVLLLTYPKTYLWGLYASTALMSAFTIYIYLILNYSDFVPCSCGGILEKLGWTEHLIFNIICVMFGAVAVIHHGKDSNHKNKKTYILLFTNLSACLLVIILFFKSEYIIKHENNFTRRFLMHPILKVNSKDMGTSSLYFAGFENDMIFLGDRNSPQNLIKMDAALSKLERSNINLDLNRYSFRKLEVKVDQDHYYIYDGTVPVIFKGKLGSGENKVISENDIFFTQLEILKDNLFILRSQSSKTKDLLLGSLTINDYGKNKTQLFPNLLEKQNDGVFDSDGYLSVDQKNKDITYIYSYRNEFLVLDSLMQLQKKLRTIDTIQKAQIKTKALSNGSNKMAKPPLKVNGHAISFEGLLFNPSELRGKNEPLERWKKNQVIDVYRTNSQEYIGSIYLEKINGESVIDFMLTKKYLFALTGNKLVQYRLTHSLIKNFKNGETENRNKE